MGNVSIDLGLENIWRSWFKFKKGKRKTRELDHFQYFLEKNINELFNDLNSGSYRHGGYQKFVVTDNKRREISVAGIRDRVVHRLMYEYLVELFNKDFIEDVWSCRKGKGLVGAIEKTQEFLKKYPRSFVWRSDVRKFFDSIDHNFLKEIIARKITEKKGIILIEKIIDSFSLTAVTESVLKVENKAEIRRGIPIGNLTSQIFANIYLNELDQFVIREIKPSAYLRYGDDFIVIDNKRENLIFHKEIITKFVQEKLHLEINQKNDIIIKTKHGLKFLGMEIFPKGRRLKKRNLKRAEDRLNQKNVASYKGLIDKHSKEKHRKYYNWIILEKIINSAL